MKVLPLSTALLLSAALLAASWLHRVPIEPTEAFGFVTGAWCVWLAVREHLWNWPIGIASSVFYIVLFWHTRLFADMSLQVVYVVLGALGWYWWLRGGQDKGRLVVTRTSPGSWAILTALVIIGTIGMTFYLRSVHDAAPFLDGLTTALSLAAQYQITKKLIENWYVWMVTDVIYIGLYVYKHLFLTAGLYALFVVLCVMGIREWRRSQAAAEVSGPIPPLEVSHG